MSVWVCFHKKKIYDQEEHFRITHAQSNRYYHLHPLSFCQSAGINQRIVCKKPLQRVIKRYSHFLQQTEESKGMYGCSLCQGQTVSTASLRSLFERELWILLVQFFFWHLQQHDIVGSAKITSSTILLLLVLCCLEFSVWWSLPFLLLVKNGTWYLYYKHNKLIAA